MDVEVCKSLVDIAAEGAVMEYVLNHPILLAYEDGLAEE